MRTCATEKAEQIPSNHKFHSRSQLTGAQKNMTRLDTTRESKDARFLVLGQMLIRSIDAYKASENTPGYELVATHPETNTSARIQVKSRWRTGAPKFNIKNLDCDFVVVVKLNWGMKDGTGEVLDPEYFVFPVAVIEKMPRKMWKCPFRADP